MFGRLFARGLGLGIAALVASTASAGSLKGTVVAAKDTAEPMAEYFQGFWPRQALSVRATPYDPRSQIAIVLEGDADVPASKAAMEVTGERLWPPVVPVVAGGDFELKNSARKQLNFTTVGSDVMKNVLIPKGGTLKATFPTVGVFPITVAGKPHMRAIVVVVAAKLYTRLDAGAFKFDNLPDGKYTLKLFYRDGWLARPPVTIEVKGNTEAPPITLDRELETAEGAAPAPAAAAAPAPAPAAPPADK